MLCDMTGSDPKTDLQRYLQAARDALLWKLDGLSEYDARRPMVPTGTNLLGLVKHLAAGEFIYFGEVFGRPFDGQLTGPLAGFGTLGWFEGAEPNADFWATADESRDQIVALYRRAWAHSDATIDILALDAIGHAPWWPEGVTLHTVLVHAIGETHRHVGHADVVRELIDGSAGLQPGNANVAPGDLEWWESHRSRLERVAQEAAKD
jgi:hypothetical protein